MTHVTRRLTAKNRNQLRNGTLKHGLRKNRMAYDSGLAACLAERIVSGPAVPVVCYSSLLIPGRAVGRRRDAMRAQTAAGIKKQIEAGGPGGGGGGVGATGQTGNGPPTTRRRPPISRRQSGETRRFSDSDHLL